MGGEGGKPVFTLFLIRNSLLAVNFISPTMRKTHGNIVMSSNPHSKGREGWERREGSWEA